MPQTLVRRVIFEADIPIEKSHLPVFSFLSKLKVSNRCQSGVNY